MSINTTTVTAIKGTPSQNITISFQSDSVGAINTKLTMTDIQATLEVASKYLKYSVASKRKKLTAEYVEVLFLMDDAEQLYYAFNVLVERGIINYNPVTAGGTLFGEEHCDDWDSFGGRLYPGATEHTWDLCKHSNGRLEWQPYTF